MKPILVVFTVVLMAAAPRPALTHGRDTAASPDSAHRSPASPLLAGLGSHHFAVSTRVPLAQRYFDQGFVLLYAFNHDEAIRSFRTALELDSTLAMAHWGIAYAMGPNINLPDVDSTTEHGAWVEAKEAVRLATNASPREQAYIAAIARRYGRAPGDDLVARRIDFKGAMRQVSRDYPEDLDAATLFAESLMDLRPWRFWTREGQPAEGTEEILQVLESVLRRNPNHAGANHYYIHATEASPHPERALASAKRLETLVPGAGHLVHMPAHVYQRVGRYADAAHRNDIAARTDEAYIRKYKVEGIYPILYYNHNLQFLCVSSMMAGNAADAVKAADQVYGSARPYFESIPMVEMVLPLPIVARVAFARWNELTAFPEPPAAATTTRGIWHFARGLAAIAHGDLASAEQERNALIIAKNSVSDSVLFGFSTARNVLRVAQSTLEGELAAARKDFAGAEARLREGAAWEDSLLYDEPADWVLPVHERLGNLLVRAHKYSEAELAYREDLKRNPASGRTLFGLAEALKRQGKTAPARAATRQYQAAWKTADTPLRVADLYAGPVSATK